MPLFTSSREKHLWLWAFVVFAAIYSTLFVGQPLAKLFSDQNMQAAIFMLGMILVGAAIVIHALKRRPGKIEIILLVGIAAVYLMLFLRLGLPERSHLMEYSVLAIFIHRALTERLGKGNPIFMPALLALVVTFLVGVIDECIQIMLPGRVFDPVDILFNGIAVTLAIGSAMVLTWVRKLRGKKN